tara:strand:+ start:307 stop:492 length:186 start_codon:yes stop_codon:yes gene_type:complete
MPQYKDFLVEHPKKGKIKLGKLSHNELCRYTFNLIIQCSNLHNALMEKDPEYAKEFKKNDG